MIIATVTSTAAGLRVAAKRASRSCRLIGNRKHGPWPAIDTRLGSIRHRQESGSRILGGNMTLAIVTPSYRSDFTLFSDLHQSVLRYTSESVKHYVIVPASDSGSFRRWQDRGAS